MVSYLMGQTGKGVLHKHTSSALSPQDFLQGDCSKAQQKLNWKPRVAFDVSCVSNGNSHSC